MSGFEYGNARLRAMRSRLLPRSMLAQLTETRSLPEFIGLFAQTPYRKSLEVALVQASDLESIYEALRRDFVDTIARVRGFYDGSERKLIDLILRQYDVHNLKTVLRGLSHHAQQIDIDTTLLPTCDLPEPLLNELLHASSPRGAIDLLATIRHPFAQPLLTLRAEQPGAELADMERALDRWRFNEAARSLQGEQEEGRTVMAALRHDVDIQNILLALRLIRYPAEQQVLKMRLGRSGLGGVVAAEGNIPIAQLERMIATKSLIAAIDLLAGTVYHAALQEGRLAYSRSSLLSEYERALLRYRLRWLSAQLVRDPLGIGVVLGYLAEKANEITNLRRAARGVQMKQPPEMIHVEMEFVQ